VAGDALTPRARVLLEAVEREVQARETALAGAPEPPVQPLRLDGALLAALELAAAGIHRAEVGWRLRAHLRIADPEPALDAVFGTGSPPDARLHRRADRA
jgi:hypothetical protein